MSKIIYYAKKDNVSEDNNNLIIKLPNNLGYYEFELDLEKIRKGLDNIQVDNLELIVNENLDSFIKYKLKGMFNKTDFSYRKYELAYIEKRIGNALSQGKLYNDKNYKKFIKESVEKGLTTYREIEEMEKEVEKRYSIHKDMKPEKKYKRIKSEVYTKIKSRSSYITNAVMFKENEDIEDFISKRIINFL